MATPKLRFKEFESEYITTTFEKLGVSIQSGKSDSKEDSGEFPFYGSTGVIGYKDSYDYCDEAILIARVGANAGSLYQVKGKYSVSDNTLMLCTSDKTNLNYLRELLIKFNLNQLVFGTGQPLVTGGMIKKVSIAIPSLGEQTKIASFLSAVDEKISQLTQKHALLTQYKQGMMQKLFSQEIRFKADDGSEFGEWKKRKVSDLFIEIKEKVLNQNIETYSITAGKGFVSQAEKFGRNISGMQNSNYIVLQPNDFSYNKGNSKTFKYGCVYLNEFDHPIAVPNVFISFRAKVTKSIYEKFYAHLFENHYLDRRLRLLISSSARMDGLLNVSKEGFFEIKLPSPCLEEQTKIANFLSAIDQKIEVVAQQIEQAKIWKKGLLQQMFV
jgi:type I restriction enzyme S subunit